MLLGKRPRPPMRRTTSMTEFAPDLEVIMDDVDAPQPSDQVGPNGHVQMQQQQQQLAGDWLERGGHVSVTGMLSPRNSNYRRNSSNFMVVETAPFLKACGLCKRRLGSGRDIYIYRGEVAFCSLECRQQHINQVEKKDKCVLSSIKTKSPTAAAGPEASGSSSGETVAAA